MDQPALQTGHEAEYQAQADLDIHGAFRKRFLFPIILNTTLVFLSESCFA